MRQIDVITIAGTGNKIGPFEGMTGLVAKKLDPYAFRVSACQYPATIGRVGAAPGATPYSLDDSVAIAVNDLAWQTRISPNPVGLISYSLGGIAAMRFLEGVAAGKFRNANGTPLEVAFHVGIANPARAEGDSVIPAPGLYGLHSTHGPLPRNTINIEVANPHDLMTSASKYNPARKIAGALSPFAALEARQTDPFKDLRNVQAADWLARFTPGRYVEAAIGLGGYLFPDPQTGVTQHTLYASQIMPGRQVTWTDWAANEINRRFS